MTAHCCAESHCLTDYEAVSLRLRLDFIGDPRYNGRNGTPSGSELTNLALAIDRLESVIFYTHAPLSDHDLQSKDVARLRTLWADLEAIDAELRAYPVAACPVKTQCAEHARDWQRVR
jgi:hypothetical protein